MTKTSPLTQAALWQFTGSEHWYRHRLNRAVTFTDGAKYVADTADAYWLLDAIAIAQRFDARVVSVAFQCWQLVVRPDQTATLTCEDGNGKVVLRKFIPFTDFPLEEITLFFTNNVIYLPNEH